jgi:hypothetical protein
MLPKTNARFLITSRPATKAMKRVMRNGGGRSPPVKQAGSPPAYVPKFKSEEQRIGKYQFCLIT